MKISNFIKTSNEVKISNGVNIAINGFGRIGRAVFKILLEKYPENKVVAINDLNDGKGLAHLLKYDSCYGKYEKEVGYKDGNLIVAGNAYRVLAERDPENLPWRILGVDIVLECTGRFTKKAEAEAHVKAGAKKVIISALAKSKEVKIIVLGVNEEKISKNDKILSMASCTTNCLAPVVEIIRKNLGLKKAIMTTVHSYTSDQNIVDGPHKDLRRARSAGVNIVPTTTGAAVATAEIIPSLAGKFDGLSVRVPTPVVSLCDIVFITKKKTDVDRVNQIFKKASQNFRYKNIIEITEEQLVSSDFIGNPASAIVDLSLTRVIGGDLVKVVAWYDNEWGYSSRLAELCDYIGKKSI